MASEENYATVLRDFEVAVSQNDDDRIKELLNTNETLFHFAGKGNSLIVVKQMIKYGANVNATDSYGVTPLHVAAQYASKGVVSVLLQNGAMFDAVDDLETKAIDVAKNQEIANLLRSMESLFASVWTNNLAEVERNVKSGAILEAKNSEGNTVLHNAACNGFYEIVETLLGVNANVNARSCEGLTPLHYAVKKSHVNVVELLLFHGALFDAVDDNGKTPFDLSNMKVLSKLFKLIRACFQKIQRNDKTVINDIARIESLETKRAVLGAKNNQENTLTVEAILRKFSKLDEFKTKIQPDVSGNVNAAFTLLHKGKDQMALKAFESALKERLRLLGPDNPLTLEVQSSIGITLQKLGRVRESLNIHQRICQKKTEMFGYNAAETLKTRMRIARLIIGFGNRKEGLEELKQINTIRDEICGSDDEELKRKAFALEVMQRYDEALEIYDSIWNDCKTKLNGAECRKTLLYNNTMALIQFRQGKFEDSLETLLSVLAGRAFALGYDDSTTIRTLAEIDFVYAKMELRPNEDSATYGKILIAKLKMAAVRLMNLQKPLNAGKLLREILLPMKQVLGAKHSKVLDCVNRMKTAKAMLAFLGKDESQVLACNKEGFMKAVISGNVKDLHHFLNIDGSPDINARDEEGRTPLHHAVSNGHSDVVDILVGRGADITSATAEGYTLLHTATGKGSNNVIKILLRRAMSLGLYDFIDAKTTVNGNTALHIAAETGQYDILRFLLAYGATYDVTNKDGRKPIDLATEEKVRNFLKLVENVFQIIQVDDSVELMALDELHPVDYFPVVQARNLEGISLMKVAKRDEILNLLSKTGNDSVAEIYF